MITTLLLLLLCVPVRSEDGIGTQREISDMIPGHHLSTTTARDNNWAVVPEFGYSPDESFNGGFKFTGRDLGKRDATLDVELNAAVKTQRGADLTIVVPRPFGESTLNVDEYHYYLSPKELFFGIGNNRVRDPIADYEIERQRALATMGWHLQDDLVFAVSAGPRQTKISHGRPVDSIPSLDDAFPSLVGLHGGRTNPLIASLVYNQRESVTRPTRGWSAIGTFEYVNQNLANDFHFFRYTLDASYLYPILGPERVLGVHVGGEEVVGRNRDIPFFELATLGGPDDMRGFFPNRFLGRAKLVINTEYRNQLADFTFRKLWDVRIDGVLFGDVGEVFISDDQVSRDFHVASEHLPHEFDEFRFSYGTGLRAEIGDAIVARLDVGFSNEDIGLVYLVFGHTF